jgi:hypothetical protein
MPNDIDGYSAAKIFLREHPDWADVLRACYVEAGDIEKFAGTWVLERVGRWLPSLRTLASAGVIEKVRTTRQGRRAYYRMPDRDGVGKALREIGIL